MSTISLELEKPGLLLAPPEEDDEAVPIGTVDARRTLGYPAARGVTRSPGTSPPPAACALQSMATARLDAEATLAPVESREAVGEGWSGATGPWARLASEAKSASPQVSSDANFAIAQRILWSLPTQIARAILTKAPERVSWSARVGRVRP